VQSGTLAITGSTVFNNEGQVTVAAGKTLTLGASGSGAGAGDYTLGAGAAVNLTAGTQTFNTGADISGTGVFTVNGGTMTVSATAMSADTLTVSSGTLNGAGALTVDSALTWSGGTMSGSGSTTVGSGATLTLSGSPLLSSRTFTNNSTTGVWSGSAATFDMSGTFVNAGTLEATGDATLRSLSATGVFTNSGTFKKTTGTGTTTFTTNNPLAFNNTGLVDVQTGTLSIGSSVTGTSSGRVTVAAGATLVAGSTAILDNLGSGTYSIANTAGQAIYNLTGSAVQTGVEVDPTNLPGVLLDLGTDRPLRGSGTCPCPIPGALLTASGATVTTQQAVKLDTALLEATLPLIQLAAATNMTSNSDLVKLTQQAKLLGTVPTDALVKLNNSTLNVTNGSLFNVAGGSFLNVTGNLFSLTSTSGNSSTLNITNGALVGLSGGSVFKLTGSFGSFSGAGTNTVNLPTSLTGFTVNTSLGFGVALASGTSISQVSVSSFTPFTGTGTVTPNGIVIKVDDPASKVRLCTTSCS
jgi:hypothetical protein